MRIFNRAVVLAMIIFTSTIFSASFSVATTLTTKAKYDLGTYLVDDKGMALYLFKKDAPGKSMCGAGNGCIEKWLPFFADTVEPKAGINSAAIGTIIRDDGRKQTTYKGQPLYYFNKDKDEDDVYGHGMGNAWYVVAP